MDGMTDGREFSRRREDPDLHGPVPGCKCTECSRKRANADVDIAEVQRQYDRACQTIAELYEAGTGRYGLGPVRGVVEDVKEHRDNLVDMVHGTRAEVAKRDARIERIRDIVEGADDIGVVSFEALTAALR